MTPKEMNRLLWKINLRLIPFLAPLYSVLFADRTLNGSASMCGMVDDINANAQESFMAVLFYILYGRCEPGTNACVKFFRPSIWLLLIRILAGVCMLAHGLLAAIVDCWLHDCVWVLLKERSISVPLYNVQLVTFFCPQRLCSRVLLSSSWAGTGEASLGSVRPSFLMGLLSPLLGTAC